MLYSTQDGTATTANGDYQAKTDTLKIAPKAVSDTIRINVVGDTRLENDETFFVNLTSAVGATIGTAQGTGTILNDDGLPQIQVTSGNTAAQGKNEGQQWQDRLPDPDLAGGRQRAGHGGSRLAHRGRRGDAGEQRLPGGERARDVRAQGDDGDGSPCSSTAT